MKIEEVNGDVNPGESLQESISTSKQDGTNAVAAASATDSESEAEFQKKVRGGRPKKMFKWTPKHEHELEELLIKHAFDFKAATREFVQVINQADPDNFYAMDVKTLQLRWTDIEIRKYRLNNAAASNMRFHEEEGTKAGQLADDSLEKCSASTAEKSAVAPSSDAAALNRDSDEENISP